MLAVLAIATLLAFHGLRRKSLSPTGALAAFTVGTLTLAPRARTFGIVLLIFYFAGSRATRVGSKRKAVLEEGHAEAGRRGARQVLCNSFTACVAAVLWEGLFGAGSVISEFVPLPDAMKAYRESYDPKVWCALDPSRANGWSRWLLLVTLGHFACCLGDTLASELGILARSPPRLITTLAVVPPGTNGGVSSLGLGASALGGFIMGLVMALSLIVENAACRDGWLGLVFDLILKGTAAGLVGSLIDSLLGATVQRTRYSNATKRILQDDTVVLETAKGDIKVVSGINVLSNNQVNLLSSISTALTVAYFGQ